MEQATNPDASALVPPDLNHFLMLETARAVEIGTDDIGNEPVFGITMARP